jgi:hypothetical protein
MDAITVEQLVLRVGHLPPDFDQEQRMIAADLGIGTAPIARELLLRYLYGRPLVDTIPIGGLYSNAAFYLLEHASGLPFVTALQQEVLPELGIHDVALAATAADARQPNEVPGYDQADVHASQLDYAPNAYGGESVLETGAGSGGLLASAPSIAKLIARYPVRNGDATHLTGREVGTRYGIWDGTSSGATSREDGLDFAFLFNRRATDAARDEIRDAIHAVLNTHGAGLWVQPQHSPVNLTQRWRVRRVPAAADVHTNPGTVTSATQARDRDPGESRRRHGRTVDSSPPLLTNEM